MGVRVSDSAQRISGLKFTRVQEQGLRARSSGLKALLVVRVYILVLRVHQEYHAVATGSTLSAFVLASMGAPLDLDQVLLGAHLEHE
jgi:hypothetical protein